MVLTQNECGFNISMRSYVYDILEMYGSDVKECVMPAKMNLFVINPSPLLEKRERELFHYTVAKLLYLGKRGRPDILLSLQFLCTRVKALTCDDQRKLERVLGYLKFSKNWSRLIDDSKFERVETYIDASFAMHEDGKIQSGCMTFLGNTLVHKGCRKQKLITKNSTEAELVALSDYVLEGELIEDFLMDLGHLMDDDLVTNVHHVYQDNTSTIVIVTTGGSKPRSKYMKVREEYIKERVRTGELDISYVKTKDMFADVLTKPLGGELFHSIVKRILGMHLNNWGAKENTSVTRGRNTSMAPTKRAYHYVS
jgi:hypothetical protein